MTLLPIAEYNFNELDPPYVQDGSINGFDGEMINGPQIVPGVEGNALRFDPAFTRYCDMGKGMGNSLGTVSALAVSMWFKVDTTKRNLGLFYIGNLLSTHGEFEINIGNPDTLRVRVSGATFDEGIAFSDTTNWHHLVCMYTGSKVQLYLDGSLTTINGNHSTDLNLSGLKTVIAEYFNADTLLAFDGKIDLVKIYDRELSPAEITALYNEGLEAMANLRTEQPIAAGVWTLIINGKTNARVYQKKNLSGGGYLTLAYDDPADDPNAPLEVISPNTDTVEKMHFDANNDWIFENDVLGYVWVAPAADEAGLLVVSA